MEPPIYEVFLVLHPVSSRLGELAHALEPLIAGEAPFTDLDVYHRAGSDTALIALHFDERRMSSPDVRRLEDSARGSGVTLVDPARMSADERRAFFDVRLPQFELIARGLSRARDTMIVLADRMGIPQARATPPDGMPRLGPPPPPRPRAGSPRPSQPRMVVTVPPLPDLPRRARGTASPTNTSGPHPALPPPRPPTLPPPPAEIPSARGKQPRGVAVGERVSQSLVEQAKQARRAAETLLRQPYVPQSAMTPTDISGPDTSPVEASQTDAVPTLGLHGLETARLQPRPPSDPGSPEAFAVIEDILPPHLDVRFLRGSEWVPVRARALSARGAYIVTGAPARLGDTVHISVGCAGRTALVRGTVYHVTTADDAVATGASGFAVRFPEYACPARTHLVQVLLAARNAGVTLRPPPNRTAVRFPVRWPVQVHTNDSAFRAEALDISSGGLFLSTSRPLDVGVELRFSLPLDLADVPLEGTGRVSRVLGSDEAELRGMHAGVGVRITDMTSTNRSAWDAFLARVRRRTEKRVLIGAAPGRVEELAASLLAAGYTVTSGSDLGLLMRVAELDPCPPDIAIIDADFDQAAAPSGWIEQVFASRQVQCVTIRGDVRRARSMVDRLLHVEA
jgi:hypothetical protein